MSSVQFRSDYVHALAALRHRKLPVAGHRASRIHAALHRHDRAWLEEVLVEDDFMLMEWRKLASRARGAEAEHALD